MTLKLLLIWFIKIGLELNSELKYLEELIEEFGGSEKISTHNAFKLLRSRYELFEQNIHIFVKGLTNKPTAEAKFHLAGLLNLPDHFPAVFSAYCFSFHYVLFTGILENAGMTRQDADPRGGYVGFGGDDRRIPGSHKFFGVAADRIEDELRDTFLLLSNSPPNPIPAALEFYRRFVKIHPFYDANGRIARLIISIYLQYFSFYINWREIDSGSNKTKFIKKLNECHKRENILSYDKYFSYLVVFFKKFIINIDNLINT